MLCTENCCSEDLEDDRLVPRPLPRGPASLSLTRPDGALCALVHPIVSYCTINLGKAFPGLSLVGRSWQMDYVCSWTSGHRHEELISYKRSIPLVIFLQRKRMDGLFPLFESLTDLLREWVR